MIKPDKGIYDNYDKVEFDKRDLLYKIKSKFIEHRLNIGNNIDWMDFIKAVVSLQSGASFCMNYGDVGLLLEGSMYIENEKHVCLLDNNLYKPYAMIIPFDQYIDNIQSNKEYNKSEYKYYEACAITAVKIIVIDLKKIFFQIDKDNDNDINERITKLKTITTIMSKYSLKYCSDAKDNFDEILKKETALERLKLFKKNYKDIYEILIKQKKQYIIAEILNISNNRLSELKKQNEI